MSVETKIYQVDIPIVGLIVYAVEATSQEEAVALAIERCTIDDLETWEPVEQDAEADEGNPTGEQ